MTQGTLYKLQNDAHFPPFSFFADFVCREANICNDPSFKSQVIWHHISKVRQPCKNTYIHKSHLTKQSQQRPPAVASTSAGSVQFTKCHTPSSNRNFQAKKLEKRKAFLKESGICFRSCSSTNHMAKDCKSPFSTKSVTATEMSQFTHEQLCGP